MKVKSVLAMCVMSFLLSGCDQIVEINNKVQEKKAERVAVVEPEYNYNVICYKNNGNELVNENVYDAYTSQGSSVYYYKNKDRKETKDKIIIANAICKITPLSE